MKQLIVASALVSMCLLTGCQTTVSYQDPSSITKPLSTNFTAQDFQQCAAALTDSMLSNPGLIAKLAKQFGDDIPTISIGKISNKTYAMGLGDKFGPMINDAISETLINSGKFNFIADRAEIARELQEEENDVTVDPSKTLSYGTGAVSDYVITGNLVEMREEQGRVKDVYYKLTLQLNNKRTGLIEWKSSKDIRKVRSRAAVSF